ncbi:hypothetical protein ACIODT_20470 [Streptomyces sp. NPDC088251]
MAASASAPPTTLSLKRIVAASLIGTTIEWYESGAVVLPRLRTVGPQ